MVRQLWSDKYTSTVLNFLSSKPAEEVLPLLQLPLQQAIRQLLQLVVRRGGVAGMPSEPCRLPAAAVMARVGSWEDLLQLLPTSAYWRHIELFQIMLAHVMVASSVAAGGLRCSACTACVASKSAQLPLDSSLLVACRRQHHASCTRCVVLAALSAICTVRLLASRNKTTMCACKLKAEMTAARRSWLAYACTDKVPTPARRPPSSPGTAGAQHRP